LCAGILFSESEGKILLHTNKENLSKLLEAISQNTEVFRNVFPLAKTINL